MGKIIKDTIHANGIDIGIYTQDFENEFISLTDIARYKSDDPTAVIQNWMRNRDVIEFLGLWERLHNPNFKPLEFEGFKKQAGANAFTMSPKKWIEATDAIGIVSKSGRYGGTYAPVSYTHLIYPTKKDAEDALCAGALYVYEEEGSIAGSIIVDKVQPTEYRLSLIHI